MAQVVKNPPANAGDAGSIPDLRRFHQTPLSMKFSRQEYRRGLPFPTPGDLLHPEIEPKSLELPALQADSLPLSHVGSPLLSITVI